MNEQLQRIEDMLSNLTTLAMQTHVALQEQIDAIKKETILQAEETRAMLFAQQETTRSALSSQFEESRAFQATQAEKTRLTLTAQVAEVALQQKGAKR